MTDAPPLSTLLSHLDALVRSNLALWDVPEGTEPSLLNVSENVTYLLTAPSGARSVLRVHRAGYHSITAIRSELAWIEALRQETPLTVPVPIPGRDGAAIQTEGSPALQLPRHMVLFEHIQGDAPDEAGDLSPGFETLGRIAAQAHLHAISWSRPTPFERLVWDLPQIFGPVATWGNWRDAPGVTGPICSVLERVESRVTQRLTSFGRGADRYGLIHADMRLANLIESPAGTRLIDFDDCGFGWFLYDFAAAISFIEDDPRIPALKAAWLRGYRAIRPLSGADEAELDTFVMLRRLALLAWIGSHIEAPEPQALAPDFASVSAELGAAWLASHASRPTRF